MAPGQGSGQGSGGQGNPPVTPPRPQDIKQVINRTTILTKKTKPCKCSICNKIIYPGMQIRHITYRYQNNSIRYRVCPTHPVGQIQGKIVSRVAQDMTNVMNHKQGKKK